jgi:hypothetical protein
MKILLDLNADALKKLAKAARKGGVPKVAESIDHAIKDDDPATDEKYRDAVPAKDGELECDGDAIVSKGGDGGAYVQCWVWVADEDAGIED